ncbi:VCBS repeat-containing protein [uncultured Dokdonia sp.]|uniref:FG-GAP repeat domain-containing protein n=1 Tax=uncultured Dokdonia sp. TaxID=575653 RepID=UPI0026093BBB|nr:VCBS repeat-containing protein [uncultured Dokdonia sp.]
MKYIIYNILLLIPLTSFSQENLNNRPFSFTEKLTEIIPVGDSANVFFDVDNDCDLDLLITGWTNLLEDFEVTTKIYLNDGKGNFKEDHQNKFRGVEYGAVDIADIDNDNDLDIVIAGSAKGNYKLGVDTEIITKIYKNTDGIFKEDTTQKFPGILWGKVKFIDINNDFSKDLLLFGDGISKIYLNDSKGIFSPIENMPFKELEQCSIAVFDIDNDQDKDIILQGQDPNEYKVSVSVYQNNTKSYTEVSHKIIPLAQGDIYQADINNDGNPDILMTGYVFGDGVPYSNRLKIYTSDGKGNFTLKNTDVVAYNEGRIVLFDIDKDQDLDLMISGERRFGDTDENVKATDLYLNDSHGTFTLHTKNILPGLESHSLTGCDIDNDGDMDFLLTGYSIDGNQTPTSELYINTSN